MAIIGHHKLNIYGYVYGYKSLTDMDILVSFERAVEMQISSENSLWKFASYWKWWPKSKSDIKKWPFPL